MLNRRMLTNCSRQRSAPREQKCAQDGGGQKMREIDESSADTLKINREINLQNELEGFCFTVSVFFRSYKSPSRLYWRGKHCHHVQGLLDRCCQICYFGIIARNYSVSSLRQHKKLRRGCNYVVAFLSRWTECGFLVDEEGGCRKSARTCF